MSESFLLGFALGVIAPGLFAYLSKRGRRFLP